MSELDKIAYTEKYGRVFLMRDDPNSDDKIMVRTDKGEIKLVPTKDLEFDERLF